MARENSNPNYTPANWLEDFRALIGFTNVDMEGTPEKLREHFYVKYPDDPHAEQNYERLKRAWLYYAKHRSEFDEGVILVSGSKGTLASQHLILALYRLFAAMPIETLSHDFKVELVMRMAKEQAGDGK
jgi:hypothetical protein